MQRKVSGVRHIDRRKDHEVHDYVVPAIQKLALDVNNTLHVRYNFGINMIFLYGPLSRPAEITRNTSPYSRIEAQMTAM